MSIYHQIWLWLGEPSRVSEFLSVVVAILSALCGWFAYKFREIEIIKTELESLDRLVNQRIDDLKK